ncbi:uncharacterized protein LOC107479860 [Arachis duranensis]|uniref:Uncharacterized protein LOC107479860 n=1 Tax=Arachis duranensis TaxID=130453 RepID=A0A6P4CRA5_ARADU|nr:uncharacterized protein LOC107479860 [Arachis duranensis]
MVAVEEVCQETEVVTEEYKEVELVRPLKTPLPRPLSPNTTFKWVNSLAFIFTFPLEYGLLETDGQLRVLCGFNSERGMASDRSWSARFNKVPRFNLRFKDWYKARLSGFPKFGYLSGNSGCIPPGWNNADQSEDGYKSKPPPPAQPAAPPPSQTPNPAAIHPTFLLFLFSPSFPLPPLPRGQPDPTHRATTVDHPSPHRPHPSPSSIPIPLSPPASTHHRGTPGATVPRPNAVVPPPPAPRTTPPLSLSHFLATALPGSTTSISANSKSTSVKLD